MMKTVTIKAHEAWLATLNGRFYEPYREQTSLI